MANALEGHKRQALIFLPGLFFMAVAWHSSWGTGSGSFGGRSLPGGQAGHAYTLCKAKERGAAGSQELSGQGCCWDRFYLPFPCRYLLSWALLGSWRDVKPLPRAGHRRLGTTLQQLRWGTRGSAAI